MDEFHGVLITVAVASLGCVYWLLSIVDRQQRSLSSQTARAQQSEQHVAKLTMRLREAEDECAARTARLLSLDNDRERLSRDYADMEAIATDAQRNLAESRKAIAAFKGEFQKLTDERNELQRRVVDLEVEQKDWLQKRQGAIRALGWPGAVETATAQYYCPPGEAVARSTQP